MLCDEHSYPKLAWQQFAPGDVDFSKVVDISDLLLMAGQWLQTGPALCPDINADGVVDLEDSALLIGHWQDFRKGYLESPYDFGAYQHKVQLHCHTTNSDGANNPVWVMQMYEWFGYTAVVITDHDGSSHTPSLIDPGSHNIIHIPGIEYTYNNSNSSWNHMIGINVKSIHHKDGKGARQSQINQVRLEGGLTFIAHPHDDHARGWSEQDLLSVCNHYDGIEILNGGTYINSPTANYPYKVDSILQAGRRINLIAVDDYHENYSSTMDRGFVVVNSDSPKETITQEEIVAALKSGNFFAAGRTSKGNPAPPRFTNITVDQFTITVETDAYTDIEFITNRYNYHRAGPNYVQKFISVNKAQYTATPDDVFVRIKATRTVGGRQSYAWSNPIYVVIE
jgi:hypothetical protein